eukprot:TRINITY_DN7025_c0_g1_i2.p1 TRINITY_DN7025_c0_g1~~TRINITY_DN7025_c0_g1_i2.p1  ORF type:complete len:211 (-),score=27.96 TRINITY_DN7025_c0_g1_i2:43-603(-)
MTARVPCLALFLCCVHVSLPESDGFRIAVTPSQGEQFPASPRYTPEQTNKLLQVLEDMKQSWQDVIDKTVAKTENLEEKTRIVEVASRDYDSTEAYAREKFHKLPAEEQEQFPDVVRNCFEQMAVELWSVTSEEGKGRRSTRCVRKELPSQQRKPKKDPKKEIKKEMKKGKRDLGWMSASPYASLA